MYFFVVIVYRSHTYLNTKNRRAEGQERGDIVLAVGDSEHKGAGRDERVGPGHLPVLS